MGETETPLKHIVFGTLYTMASQTTPLYSMTDGTVISDDDALRMYLKEINAALKYAPDVSSYNADVRARDLWHDTAYFFDADKQLAQCMQNEVSLLAHLIGRKYAVQAKLKMKLPSCSFITALKMNRCVEQANLETLVSTSTTPTRLHDKGFYVKTKDGQVHHLRVGVLYIATTYAADGKREHHLRVQPAEYRFPLWINIPKAAALFKAFTSNLDKPTLERVAKTMPGDNGIKSTTYWGVFGGAYHYTKHLLKCATDETTGNVIPFKLFCDRWIEVAGERERVHCAHPPCLGMNQGSGCSNDPYIAGWDHLCTEQNQFMQDTPQEQTLNELKFLGVWPRIEEFEEFYSPEDEAIHALDLLGGNPNVPEPFPIRH